MTVILENVTDWHNVGAVMRSCDAVGIGDLYVLYTDLRLRPTPDGNDYSTMLGKRTTAGTRKWVQVHYFEDISACFDTVRQKHGKIYTTSLHGSDELPPASLYELDMVQPAAYLFGNEHVGVSEKAVALADGNFTIPQMGIVDSLNISVACAVTLFEAMRQRLQAGKYKASRELSPEALPYYEKYIELHKNKWSRLPVIMHE